MNIPQQQQRDSFPAAPDPRQQRDQQQQQQQQQPQPGLEVNPMPPRHPDRMPPGKR